jgi:hypothetical protein
MEAFDGAIPEALSSIEHSLLLPGERVSERGLAARLAAVGGPLDLFLALPDFQQLRSASKVSDH